MTLLTQRFHQLLVVHYLKGARNTRKAEHLKDKLLSKIPVAVCSPSKEVGRKMDKTVSIRSFEGLSFAVVHVMTKGS